MVGVISFFHRIFPRPIQDPPLFVSIWDILRSRRKRSAFHVAWLEIAGTHSYHNCLQDEKGAFFSLGRIRNHCIAKSTFTNVITEYYLLYLEYLLYKGRKSFSLQQMSIFMVLLCSDILWSPLLAQRRAYALHFALVYRIAPEGSILGSAICLSCEAQM